MTRPCCSKPVAKIISVGSDKAGILDLDSILRTARASGKSTEEDLKAELLALARMVGNYIAPGSERAYKEALLREYRDFCKKQQ